MTPCRKYFKKDTSKDSVILLNMTTYPPLAYLNANIDTVTFSGHSAGCQFSNTMLVIHSATIKGAGLMQCGPYSLDLPDYHKPGETKDDLVQRSMATLKANDQAGSIDSTENLKNAAIYLVDGTEDTTIPLIAVDAVNEVFTTEGVKSIDYVTLPIKHDWHGSKPVDGIKYIYTQLGFAPDGFNEPSD